MYGGGAAGGMQQSMLFASDSPGFGYSQYVVVWRTRGCCGTVGRVWSDVGTHVCVVTPPCSGVATAPSAPPPVLVAPLAIGASLALAVPCQAAAPPTACSDTPAAAAQGVATTAASAARLVVERWVWVLGSSPAATTPPHAAVAVGGDRCWALRLAAATTGASQRRGACPPLGLAAACLSLPLERGMAVDCGSVRVGGRHLAPWPLCMVGVQFLTTPRSWCVVQRDTSAG